MFGAKKTQKRELTRVQKRIQMLSDPEIVTWMDSSIYAISRNLADWRRTQEPLYLEEARMGAEVLHEALEALNRRTNAGR